MLYTRTQRTLIVAALIASGAAEGALAETLHVPGDFPSIQAAIDAASHGDEILVAPGVYNEAIRFLGKAIMVRSSKGPEVTILDGSGSQRSVVSFTSGEDFASIIDGFAITGGSGTPAHGGYRGGGLYIIDSAPTVSNCVITGNTATIGGGAYINSGAQPWIVGSTLAQNVASTYGGGIYSDITGAEDVNVLGATIIETVFVENMARFGGAFRGGMNVAMMNCSFKNNAAVESTGGVLFSAGQLMLQGCTFEGNAIRAVGIGPQADASIISCSFSQHTSGAVSAWTSAPGRTLSVIDSTFENNSGLQGAAIGIAGGFAVTISGSDFKSNSSSESGGAVKTLCAGELEVHCPDLSVIGSVFRLNDAGADGGAIAGSCGSSVYSAACSLIDVQDTLFARNTAGSYGGAIYNRCIDWIDPATDLPVTTCGEVYVRGSVLERNVAGDGGGAIANDDESSAVIEDSDMCSNVPEHVQGEWEDEGGNEMAASTDLDCDGAVGVSDLLMLLNLWGLCEDGHSSCVGDFNRDAMVGVGDLLMLLAKWG